MMSAAAARPVLDHFAAVAAAARPIHTEAERDALVRENLGLVHHLAQQLRRGPMRAAEYDELVSAGALGLIQAVDSFDPARGIAFSTFATPRIRGAMLDELARLDDTPRRVRRTARQLAAAEARLTAANGRAPTDPELAASLGVDVETLRRWRLEAAGIHRRSIDAPRGEEAGPAPLELPAPESAAPGVRLDRVERTRVLADAILALKEQHRAVLALYYFAEVSFAQIARVYGITQSRVSQIHKQALAAARELCAVPLGRASA